MGTQATLPAGYPAPVPNPPAPPGWPATPTHGGPSFRLSVGLGYWRTGFSHPQPSTIPAADASGFTVTALTLGAALGGVVWRNLTVFGELLGTRASELRVKDSLGVKTTWPGTYGLVSVGPGVSYYFDRINAHVSGTLTITRLFGKEIDADLGRGANLGIGKDWRAATGSRVGLVAAFQYAKADDEYRGTTVSLVSSLRFSVAWQ